MGTITKPEDVAGKRPLSLVFNDSWSLHITTPEGVVVDGDPKTDSFRVHKVIKKDENGNLSLEIVTNHDRPAHINCLIIYNDETDLRSLICYSIEHNFGYSSIHRKMEIQYNQSSFTEEEEKI